MRQAGGRFALGGNVPHPCLASPLSALLVLGLWAAAGCSRSELLLCQSTSECPKGTWCQEGGCVAGYPPGDCKAPLSACEGRCIDLARDPKSCGECGRACGVSQVCMSGICASACSIGTDACSRSCVDLATDNAHCGACDVACPPDQSCRARQCVCQGMLTACGGDCFNLQSDAKHCGTCLNACSGAQRCIAGVCL